MCTPRSYGLGLPKGWECQKDLVRQKTVNGYCYLDENPKLRHIYTSGMLK